MKAKRLLIKADFAQEAGVSRAAMTKACKGTLKAAMVGKDIDIDHPDAIAYLKKKKATKTQTVPIETSESVISLNESQKRALDEAEAATKLTVESHYSKDASIRKILDLTIHEVVEQYGTDKQFLHWVDARKTIEDIRHKQLKTAKEEGELIPRALIKQHIFGSIDASNKRLLSDVPKTLSERLFSLIKAGGSKKEAETLIRDTISAHIKNVKTTAKRVLRK